MPRPRPRRIGYRGGTSSRVADYRHQMLNKAWFERVDRDKT